MYASHICDINVIWKFKLFYLIYLWAYIMFRSYLHIIGCNLLGNSTNVSKRSIQSQRKNLRFEVL